MVGQVVYNLPPARDPIGIFLKYMARQSETLVLKEMISLTDDSFDIKHVNGQPILRVEGKVISLSGWKSVYDMSENHLLDIFKEHFHLHTTFVAQDPRCNNIMELQSNFALMGSKTTATFVSQQTGKSPHYRYKYWPGCRQDRQKQDVITRFFGRKQTYALTVTPGVDMALMCALCICLDEKNNDREG